MDGRVERAGMLGDSGHHVSSYRDLLMRGNGLLDTRNAAPPIIPPSCTRDPGLQSQLVCISQSAMPRPRKAPESMLALTEDLTVPALTDSHIASLASLLDAPPEQFQMACATLFRRLALAGFREIRPPRNYRELATVIDLWRKMEGLDKDKGQAVPVGLVGVLRGVSRRVVEAETVEPEPSFD